MPLTPELRARMAKDMQQNRKFDGDTDIPAQCRAFAGLADMETVERPAVCGFPYKLYVFTAKNKKPGSPLHVNIHGGGWLGDDALAIAVYAALRYPGDLKACLRAAVNHGGDSDSTGAIAGNILGAWLGMAGIPEDWHTRIELADRIEELSDRMQQLLERC